MDHFDWTAERRTFTYCKPLIVEPGSPPRELNRLDHKNWTPTPETISRRIRDSLLTVAREVDAIILMSQVDKPETGVLTVSVLEAVGQVGKSNSGLTILADSRSGFANFPTVIFKMNQAELQRFVGGSAGGDLAEIGARAASLAKRNGLPVFVTLSQQGMLGASPHGAMEHLPALPVHGPIDVVGAGDAVTANLALALASGASVREALELANAAASIVIHQLGMTGVATVEGLRSVLLATENAGVPP